MSRVEPLKSPQMATESNTEWSLAARCGRMFEKSFQRDAKYQFIQRVMRKDLDDVPSGQTLTSFTATRNMFEAFLGKLELKLQIMSEQAFRLPIEIRPRVCIP